MPKLKYYLLGRHLTLVTDYTPLVWMSRNKVINDRVTRWFLSVQQYRFFVVHRSWSKHGNGEALSRLNTLWTMAAPPAWSELTRGVCDGVTGWVCEGRYIADSWLHLLARKRKSLITHI